jgi:hypothetical protein
MKMMDNLENLDVDERIILRQNLKETGFEGWTAFIPECCRMG